MISARFQNGETNPGFAFTHKLTATARSVKVSRCRFGIFRRLAVHRAALERRGAAASFIETHAMERGPTMSWQLLAFLAPALWAASNHVDKYLVSRYFKAGGAGALVIFAGLTGLIIAGVILALNPGVLDVAGLNGLYALLSGLMLGVSYLPYLYALNEDEAAVVVPLQQVTPLFGFVLGYFCLGEALTGQQLAACLIIVAGSVFLTYEPRPAAGRSRIKWRVLGLAMLSSFLYAVTAFAFKLFALKEDYWSISFWQYLGLGLFGLILLAVAGKYRRLFMAMLRHNRVPIIGLNLGNELLNIGAKFLFNYAALMAPLALVMAAGNTQPLFVFAYGLILVKLCPRFSAELVNRERRWQKAIAIAVIFGGSCLLI